MRNQSDRPQEEDAKAKQENKRVRQDKDVVLDLLFTAFHKHEFYNIRDLVQKTKQPPVSVYNSPLSARLLYT